MHQLIFKTKKLRTNSLTTLGYEIDRRSSGWWDRNNDVSDVELMRQFIATGNTTFTITLSLNEKKTWKEKKLKREKMKKRELERKCFHASCLNGWEETGENKMNKYLNN